MLLSKVHQILLCRTGLLALLVAATMSVSALSAEEEAQTRSDRLLPPGVLLHIRISDVSDMKERLPQTGFGKLYADKSMDKVRGKIEEAFAKAYAEAGKELGFPLTDLLNIPSGEVSFSLLQPAGRSLAGVVMMDIGDEKETLDKALAKLDEALTSKGAKKKSETIEEVEVTVYDIPKDGNGGGDEPQTFCYFTHEEVFVGGSDLSVLEDVLTRWDGDSDDVLAEEEVYSYIRGKCATRKDDEDSVLEWYVDPMGLVTAALNSNEDLSTQALMVSAYLPTLGLDKFKGLGGNLDLAEGGYDMHSKSFMYVDQPTTGVLRAFEFPATALTPPAWVKATTPQYSGMNWDLSGAYTALTEMADAFSQPGMAKQQVAQIAKQIGFHPKDDLIDHLDGQMVILGDIDAKSDEPKQMMLFGAKLKNAKKFQETLDTMLEKSGSEVTKRDFEGTTVYDIQSPNEEVSPALAIAKDYFFITSHAEMLEDVLRPSTSGDETLAASKGFKAFQKLAPAKTSMLTYSDSAKQFKPIYDALKSGKLAGVAGGDFDFSIFPDYEKIQKYLSVSGTYTVPDEKGVYSEGFLFSSED